MMTYMDMNMTLFHGLGMFIFWFILIYLLFSLLNTKNSESKNTISAIEILKQRFAKGEITKEQFNEIKKSII